MFDSVRTRLTLWYAGVLALSLVAFALVELLLLVWIHDSLLLQLAMLVHPDDRRMFLQRRAEAIA